MDWDFITPRIAVGAALQNVEDVETLVAGGVTNIIDCTESSYESTTSWFAQHPALSVLWNPTPDDGMPKGVDWFKPSVEYGAMALSRPGVLYCHCENGRNRGPSTAAAVMMALGWEFQETLDKIEEARPVTKGYIRYAPDAANALREMGYMH